MPTIDLLRDLLPGTTRPVAFFSRKLTPGQASKWTVEEKETYAIVTALEKYSGVVGVQPVLVLTDHRTLQSWHKRAMDTPAGMYGRRARWHKKLSRFDIFVHYIPGAQSELAVVGNIQRVALMRMFLCMEMRVRTRRREKSFLRRKLRSAFCLPVIEISYPLQW